MGMKKNFKREVLDNGVTLLFEKRDFPVSFVSITSKIGAIYETQENRGITHFMEHLIFEGTKSRTSEQISSEIEGSGGEINAETDEGFVSLYGKVPYEETEKTLLIFIDMIKNSLFDEKKIVKEKKVIFEEIGMEKDNPLDYSNSKSLGSLYGGIISGSLLGKKEVLEKITREELIKKYKEVFSPENLVVCVVGNYSFEKLKKIFLKEFKKDSGFNLNPSFISKKISHKKELRRGIDQARFVFGFYSPPPTDKKSFSAEILSSFMLGGFSSKLYNLLREEGLVYDQDWDITLSPLFSYVLFTFGTSKRKLLTLKKRVLEEFERISKNFSQEEFDYTCRKIIGSFKLGSESCQEEGSQLISYELERGNAEMYYDLEKNFRSVTLEEVKSLAKEVANGNYGTFTLLPKE